MELEKSKEILNKFCEYEDSVVLIDNALIEIQEAIEAVLQALENSIPKEKVETEIKELDNMKVEGEAFTTAVNFAKKTLQELLEE